MLQQLLLIETSILDAQFIEEVDGGAQPDRSGTASRAGL